MLKKVLLIILILAVISAAAIFVYRHAIIQYSAESIIRKALPSYIIVDSIKLEFANSRLVMRGFKIINPSGFSEKYIMA